MVAEFQTRQTFNHEESMMKRTFLTIVTFLVATITVFMTPRAIADAGFEAPVVGAGKYLYRPVGGPWTFSLTAGISGNGSSFTSGNQNAPEGVQVAFLQKNGYCSQAVDAWAGSYRVYFKAAQRGNNGTSREDFAVTIDGIAIGTFTPSGTLYQPYSTPIFQLSGGSHTLGFRGLNSVGGDNTVLIDAVRLIPEAPYPPGNFSMTINPQRTQYGNRGDMWPLSAWAADDNIYSSCGDGFGFGGTVELGMHQLKIAGSPPNIVGTNISSPTGETKGLGATDMHASSSIAVDGLLHMFVRNYIHTGTDGLHSTLASSADNAKTWSWVNWSSPMGYPVFLGFGKEYAGARDQYLYFYSPDTESAYDPSDKMILGRVDKSLVRDLASYTYYSGLNSNGAPIWSLNLADHQPIFQGPGECYRPSICYNPGIGRYLMAMMVQDTHHLGIYDAPEPWGPWTTVYYTHDFQPNDRTYCPQIATKWLSGNGLSGWLVYSSYPTNYRMNMQQWTLQLRSGQVLDPGFEQFVLGSGQFRYNPTGTSWTFVTDSGITSNGSSFTNGNPPAPQGTQVAFLQKLGSFSQTISGWNAGSYQINFQAAQRANYGTRQNFNVLIDGNNVGTFATTNTSYQSFTTNAFQVQAGSHTITFQGLNSLGGDSTSFIDNITIQAN